jgi:hypothetical protein
MERPGKKGNVTEYPNSRTIAFIGPQATPPSCPICGRSQPLLILGA